MVGVAGVDFEYDRLRTSLLIKPIRDCQLVSIGATLKGIGRNGYRAARFLTGIGQESRHRSEPLLEQLEVSVIVRAPLQNVRFARPLMRLFNPHHHSPVGRGHATPKAIVNSLSRIQTCLRHLPIRIRRSLVPQQSAATPCEHDFIAENSPAGHRSPILKRNSICGRIQALLPRPRPAGRNPSP